MLIKRWSTRHQAYQSEIRGTRFQLNESAGARCATLVHSQKFYDLMVARDRFRTRTVKSLNVHQTRIGRELVVEMRDDSLP